MFDQIYGVVQTHPQEVSWAFAFMNAVWLLFTYFKQQSHERGMTRVQHDMNLDLERRKTVFTMKTSSYERYVRMLDEFGARHQTGLFRRMQPCFATYMESMVKANGDNVAVRTALSKFSQDVLIFIDEASQNFLKIRAETRTLKLTASDQLVAFFDALDSEMEKSMNDAQTFITDLPKLQLSGNQEEINTRLGVCAQSGAVLHRYSKEIEAQMRIELKEI